MIDSSGNEEIMGFNCTQDNCVFKDDQGFNQAKQLQELNEFYEGYDGYDKLGQVENDIKYQEADENIIFTEILENQSIDGIFQANDTNEQKSNVESKKNNRNYTEDDNTFLMDPSGSEEIAGFNCTQDNCVFDAEMSRNQTKQEQENEKVYQKLDGYFQKDQYDENAREDELNYEELAENIDNYPQENSRQTTTKTVR